MKNYALIIVILIVIAMMLSCSAYKNDKCWISEEKYSEAKKYYDKTGSLDLTMQYLKDKQWRRCEINEAKYRLIKEYDLE